MNAPLTAPPGPAPAVPPTPAAPRALGLDAGAGFGPGQAELGILNLMGQLASRPWWLLGGALLGLLGGGLWFLHQTPVYQTTAVVQVESRQRSLDAALGSMGALLGSSAEQGVFGSPGGTNAEIEVVGSRMVLGPVIAARQLDLRIRPRRAPLVGAVLGRLADGMAFRREGFGTFDADGLRLEIGALAVPERQQGRPYRLVALGHGAFRLDGPGGDALGTGQVGARLAFAGGSLFVRDLVAPPGQGFELAVLDPLLAYEDLRERLQVIEQGRQSGVLLLILDDPDPRHGALVLNDVVGAYLRQNVERKSAEAQKTLEFLEGELPQLKDRLTTAEGAFNSFRLRNQSADLTKETDIVLQQSAELETQLLTLQQKRDELVRRFQPTHPSVQAVDEQIARVRGAIGGQGNAIRRLPQVQQDLLRLKRDVDVTNTLYLSLLNNAQELRIARAGTVGNVRIIDSALPRLKPVRPRLGPSLLGGGLLGLVAGALASWLRVLTSRGLADPATIERVTGQPVVASIPFSARQRRLLRGSGRDSRLLAVGEPTELSVESLRSLRTSLHFLMLDATNNRLLLTGPGPALGKSFVALNLGAVVAQAGRRVVVIDADLRRGRLQDYLETARDPGVTEYVASGLALDAVVRRTAQPQLDIVTTGRLPPNPAELLLHPRFAQLLEECSRAYDLVIIDSPPVLAVADPMIIAQHADTVLMVLKHAQHPAREIDQALARLEQVGARLRGIIVNQVRPSSGGGEPAYVYQYSYRPRAG